MARPIDPQMQTNILAAARRVFLETPLSRARMSDIAKEAGIAVGTIYIYFRSKEDLATGLAKDYVRRIADCIAVPLQNPDSRQMISDVVSAALTFAEQEKDLLVLLDLRSGLGHRAGPLPEDENLVRLIATSLQERIETGQVKDYDPVILAELLGGFIEWVSKAIYVWGNGNRQRYESTVVHLIQEATLNRIDMQ